MREFLRGLDFDEELIDAIMAEHGKLVTKDKEALSDLKSKLKDLEEAKKEDAGFKEKYEALTKKLDEEKAEKKKKAEDEAIEKSIIESLGDKKFVNDYTKKSVVNEIRTALEDEANKGKSVKDLLKDIAKDKKGLFVNPNQMVDMAGIDESVENTYTKEDFDKMGYKERLQFKQDNPELFKKYNG